MSAEAKITVLTGPDRGKSCALTGELTRVGRGPENDLVLSDTGLADHLASIVQRDGRYAIISTVAGGLEIDGTEVPAERWVWLPEAAQIKVSRRTALQFTINGAGGGAESTVLAAQAAATTDTRRVSPPDTPVAVKPAPGPPRRPPAEPPGSSGEVRRARRSTERGDRKARQVARFITDGPGDPLVKLGEDGHLPELMLKEGQVIREGKEQQARQQNPMILVAALGASIGLTLLMLVMDSGGFGDNAADKARARVAIADYYGEEGETLKPYQLHLRKARQARARGDAATERSEYRRVLGLLRSESKDKMFKYTGLTGRLDDAAGEERPHSDRHLEELISVLLSE